MDHFRLRTLPISARLAITGFIAVFGFGYMFALLNLYIHLSKADGVAGLTSSDVVITFHGPDSKQTMLEAKITTGSMKDFIPNSAEDPNGDLARGKIVKWTREGAKKEGFAAIKPILKEGCVGCHSPGNTMEQVPFAEKDFEPVYEKMAFVLKLDRGKSLNQLVQSSHTHLISMGMMFFFLALLFYCTGAPSWLKNILLPLPFLGILFDVGGWWLTKYIPFFANMVMAGGSILGTTFAIFSLGILGECWFVRSTSTAAQLSKEYQRSRPS
jgi:hypothetical protein